jgi:DNA-binding transcriptional MerR regulator
MEYSMKQASEITGLTAHTLRYYEKEGLLPDVHRTKSGIRRFSQEDIDGLGLICCLKSTGMSIKQIREFVELSLKGDSTLKRRCAMLIAHKKDVEEQMLQMQKHIDKVTHKIEYFTSKYEALEAGK